MALKYKLETDAFRKNFASFRNQRIAIYGIGRRTLTLLPGIRDFHIIGLLDRDPANVDKCISNVPVITLAEAEKRADVIIVNSDPTNFQVIYQRIAGTRLPVYYANGERATLPRMDYAHFAYWDKTAEQLRAAIRVHDIITFDFFDTLAMRRCLDPADVFRILEQRLGVENEAFDGGFARERQAAVGRTGESEPTLATIYRTMADAAGLAGQETATLHGQEMQLEEQLCLPRQTMVGMLRYAMELGKPVYIISDTQLPMGEFQRLLKVCGLSTFPRDKIWLSCERGQSKREGNLWCTFRKEVGMQSVLHIGDDAIGDGERPQAVDIDVFPIWSAKKMLAHSNVARLVAMATTLTDVLHLGLIASEVCNDPFALAATRGRIDITRAEQFGYLVFGSSILRYLSWVLDEARGARQIGFFARDGYFLKQDFDYLRTLLADGASKGTSLYIPVSRRLLYLATMETDDDFRRTAMFPYTGTFADYMKSRFEVTADERSADANGAAVDMDDADAFLHLVRRYALEIRAEAARERRNYKHYLARLNASWDDTVTVDLGDYGTNQHYFQRIIGQRVKGCYFYACYMPENEYLKDCDIHCCYNDAKDPAARQNPIKQKSAFMESFLTAPYGMIRFIDDDGSLVCEPDRGNQKYFAVKQAVNVGIQRYLKDFITLYGAPSGNGIDRIDGKIYREFLQSGSKIANDILRGFYFDNDMVGSKEMPLEV